MTATSTVIDLIEAFRRSKAMFVAVQLGVFDHLSSGSADAPTLAKDLGANGDALERLLDTCAALGLLDKFGKLYSNNAEASRYLVKDSPDTLAGYILYSDRALYPMWGNLADAVREGTHRWKQTFDANGPIFDHFFASEDSMRTFTLGMHGFGMISSPRIVEAFDLSRFQRLVDLGGASGHLANAACQRYPHLRAVVFDLPKVCKVAREHAGDRVEVAEGDFFTDSLPAADLYALGRILHDWSEEKIARLLAKIVNRLPAGGGLLIAEKLLEPDKSGPVSALMQSLNMLVCTEGKERTLEEYTALLTAAGFSKVEGRRTGTPLDAILAIK